MAPLGGLPTFPEEIIDNICSNLEAANISNLRLTCKALHHKADHQWVAAYFQLFSCMITKESLQTLVDIAKDKRFGLRIKKLQICLVTFPQFERTRVDAIPITEEQKQKANDSKYSNEKLVRYPRELKRDRRRWYGRHMSSQHTLRKQAIDAELLVEALCHLPALESIALLDEFDTSNPPWCARKIRAEIGRYPPTTYVPRQESNFHMDSTYDEHFGAVIQFCSHALALTLGAIVRSQIKLKESLVISGLVRDFSVPQNPQCRKVQPTGTPAKTFSETQVNLLAPAFAELKELSLKSYHYHSNEYPLSSEEPHYSWLEKYLPLWPAIQILSLGGANVDRDTMILRALLQSDNVAFPHLRHLKIHHLKFVARDLTSFMIKHRKTLQSLVAVNSYVRDEDCLDIVHAAIGAPLMTYMELLEERLYTQFAFELHRSALQALRVRKLYIKEDTPASFQLALESIYDAVRSDGLIDIEYT